MGYYVLYINDEFHSSGNYNDIEELMRDYKSSDMYGQKEVKFKIRKIESLKEMSDLVNQPKQDTY